MDATPQSHSHASSTWNGITADATSTNARWGIYTCVLHRAQLVSIVCVYGFHVHLYVCVVCTDLLHAPHGANQARGGRSHSPSAPHYTSTEVNSPDPSSFPNTTAPHISKQPIVEPIPQSCDSQVQSWEEIDDMSTVQPPSVPNTSSQTLTPTTATTETELKTTDSRSNSSSGRSTPNKLQEPAIIKDSSSASSSSTPDLAKIERKQPSPALGGATSRGEASGKGNKHYHAPPPKDADEKENINIVFIGHVGRCIYTCTCRFLVTFKCFSLS